MEKTHIPLYRSMYAWQPGMDGKLFSWSTGEVVTYKGSQVRIDSALMSHDDSPSGFIYECVYLDGSGRFACDPTYFEPYGERLAEIESGRALLEQDRRAREP